MVMLVKKMKYISNFVFGIFLVCFCCLKMHNSYVYAGPEKVVKVSFVGETNAGKTAVINKLCGLNFNFSRNSSTNTEIAREKTSVYDDNTVLCYRLYDITSQKNSKAQVLDKNIAGSNFIVVVIDALNNCEDFMERQMIGWMQEIKVRYPNTHVIWLFTKIDLLAQERRQELEQNITQWVNLYRDRVSHLFVSVKTGENMDQFFDVINRVIREKNLLPSLPDYKQKMEEQNYNTMNECTIL